MLAFRCLCSESMASLSPRPKRRYETSSEHWIKP